MSSTLCFYWRSKRPNKDGECLTHSIVFDIDSKQFKHYSSPAIPQGQNAMEVTSKFDLEKLEKVLLHFNFKLLP